MKKLLLGLGTIVAVTAPVISVVACSSESSKKDFIVLDGNMIYEKNISRIEFIEKSANKKEGVNIYSTFKHSDYAPNYEFYAIKLDDFKVKLKAAGWTW